MRLSSEDGIQLITSQKAKGSEWQAVIVPFLGRDLRVPSPRYPSLIKTPGSGEVIVALSKEDPSDELKKARELSQRQEMERLLYVATTRARHTLVLALDAELFLDAKGELSRRAQLKLLRGEAGGKNVAQFDALRSAARPCELTSERRLQILENEELSQQLPEIDPKTVKTARARAADFVHKFNPSAYDAEIVGAADDENGTAIRPMIRARSATDSPATLYGRWWHSLFEAISWKAGVAAAERLSKERQPHSPDRSRSAAEWKLVRALFEEPILMRFISQETTHTHAEFPFAWSISPQAALEGVIDLLLIDRAAGKCLLIDWKTNRIAKGKEESMRTHYRPQIAAYWKAIHKITRLEVEAGLYSTSTGALAMFDPAALETEWARLATLPTGQMRAEVAPADLRDAF